MSFLFTTGLDGSSMGVVERVGVMLGVLLLAGCGESAEAAVTWDQVPPPAAQTGSCPQERGEDFCLGWFAAVDQVRTVAVAEQDPAPEVDAAGVPAELLDGYLAGWEWAVAFIQEERG